MYFFNEFWKKYLYKVCNFYKVCCYLIVINSFILYLVYLGGKINKMCIKINLSKINIK